MKNLKFLVLFLPLLCFSSDFCKSEFGQKFTKQFNQNLPKNTRNFESLIGFKCENEKFILTYKLKQGEQINFDPLNKDQVAAVSQIKQIFLDDLYCYDEIYAPISTFIKEIDEIYLLEDNKTYMKISTNKNKCQF